MNEQNQVNLNDVLALLGAKELEISLLRKALASYQRPVEIPREPQTPSEPQPPTHHPV